MGEDSESKGALVKIDVTGEAATTFVKKVSRFVGGMFGPWQRKRMARAEAEAARVQAASDIEVTDMYRRAEQRRKFEDAAHQENMEAIASLSVTLLTDGAKANAVDDDWMANFFEKCRNISNEQMQSVWSRVLAGEVNEPGTFSRRTVNAIADLDQADCEMFTRLCSFAWVIGGVRVPVILDKNDPIYTEDGITFALLSHLQSIGLIHYSEEPSYHLEAPEAEFWIKYGAPWRVRMHALDDDRDSILQALPLTFRVGHVLLTKLGEELAEIAGGEAIPGFVPYATGVWRDEHMHSVTLT
jgi:hypothetical protein